MTFDFWRSAPTKIKRMLTILSFVFLSIIITVAGILTPLTDEEINISGEGLDATQQTIDGLPEMQQVSLIFGNNFVICLVGFVPVIGAVFECYVLYSTGVVISAYTAYKGFQVDPLLLFFSLFLFPFVWLEFLAYSTAMAESFWLMWRMVQRKGKNEIKNACILISICAIMLLTGAIIEAALI
ncbi:hypothetical protein E3J49_01295 [Candidatus Bathyarchaeota archaeon]|nr:MAG: hypothetical protein E3J49_01295 [Candidatus Bathyarchaeota archaeon]